MIGSNAWTIFVLVGQCASFSAEEEFWTVTPGAVTLLPQTVGKSISLLSLTNTYPNSDFNLTDIVVVRYCDYFSAEEEFWTTVGKSISLLLLTNTCPDSDFNLISASYFQPSEQGRDDIEVPGHRVFFLFLLKI